MSSKALFDGLIVDEDERPVETCLIGGEAFYVIDDGGFRRHVESRFIDRQVLDVLREQIRGHEELISQGTMKMLGQEDIFTKAMIDSSLKNLDSHFEALLEQGLPEEARAWLGMTGFRVVVNVHGEIVRVEQPAAPEDSRDE
ncbi:MAG: hypothetical protein AB1449_02925 [Chloroflexota bacterium]